MRHEITVYSALLACGLGAAYWASLPKASLKQELSPVFTLDKAQIEQVSWVSGPKTSTITKVENSKRYWVTVGSGVAKKGQPADNSSERFVANRASDKFFQLFSPFQALRTIGKANVARLKKFGFVGGEESKEEIETFTIKANSGKDEFKYQVGAKSYGSKNIFVLNQKTQIIYLIPGGAISFLENAKRKLFEREIFDFEFDDAQLVEVLAQDKKVSMRHDSRDAKGNLVWVEFEENKMGSTSNKAPSESFKNWMRKIEKLRVINYLNPENKEDVERVSAAKEVLLLRFMSGNKLLGTFSVKKVEIPAEAKAPKAYQYWARAGSLPTWALISRNRMDSVEKDISSFLK